MFSRILNIIYGRNIAAQPLSKIFMSTSSKKKLVCEDGYMTQLTFFESEVTLPVRIDHIVAKDLYCTLKLFSLDCSHCDTAIFYMRQRADLYVTCAERVIYSYQQEALYNDVDSQASTIVHNNE